MRSGSESARSTLVVPGLRRYLYVTAAVGGAAVLVIEILGAKMLAPYVGTSHFVWTAQIAVTLVALAAGYAAGGWLAGRPQRLRWIYAGLLLAAVWLCGSALGCETVAFACLRFRLAAGSLLAAGILFFVPLALLAMIGPVIVCVLTSSIANVGRNVGRLSAISTLGSVAGTVLIGYVLIPFMANSTTLCATAGSLVLVSGGYFLIWDRRERALGLAGVGIIGFLAFAGAHQRPFAVLDRLEELYRCNSNFGLMQVVDNQSGTRRYYLNDLLTQNAYDPQHHRSASLFTYVLEGLAQAYTDNVRDALCLGMGVGVVPMRLAQAGARVDVVEINPAVVPLAQRYFDFRPEQVRLEIGDARYALHTATNQYDLVVLDAFLGESPPAHLMTQEAFQAVQRCLKAGGVVVMNTFGEFDAGKDFLSASLERTLQSVFRTVRVHAAGNGNTFYVASDQADLPVRRLPDFDAMPSELRWLAERALTSTRSTDPAHGRVLTDDYNPADYCDALNREGLRRRLAFSYRPH